MKDITVLVAHCDDEFLFMFPALIFDRVKRIVCVTSDIHNSERQWCSRRKEGFLAVADLVKAEGICLDYSSDFFRLPKPDLFKCVSDIGRLIQDSEIIFTHNAWGEYGHFDHILCHNVARTSGRHVLTQDIALQADWYPVKAFRQGEVICRVKNDLGLHDRCMDIYTRLGAMGWGYPAVLETNVIEVKS